MFPWKWNVQAKSWARRLWQTLRIMIYLFILKAFLPKIKRRWYIRSASRGASNESASQISLSIRKTYHSATTCIRNDYRFVFCLNINGNCNSLALLIPNRPAICGSYRPGALHHNSKCLIKPLQSSQGYLAVYQNDDHWWIVSPHNPLHVNNGYCDILF